MEIKKANNEKWLHKIERSMKEGIKNKANEREPLCWNKQVWWTLIDWRTD